jgi:outer membrane receptor protein involved in Fe transport
MQHFSSRRVRAALVAGSAIVAGFSAAAAQAQEQADDAPAVADTSEIIVTARGREQSLQDVSVAVSVVSGEALERADLRSLQDVTARLPNVRINNGTNTDVLVVRGVGSGANVGFEQAVGTFVDGVYRGRSRATRASLFDLDRVEVLRGPQTTFFGQNAVAGALNIITRKPGGTFAANASALYEIEHGEYALEAGITTPVSDTLSVRVAGRLSGMDGFVENVTLDRDGPRMRDAIGRVSVRFEPTDNFTSDLRFDIARLRSRDAFPGEIVGCPPPAAFGGAGFACGQLLANPAAESTFNFQAAGRESFFNYDYTEVAWTNSLELDGITLTSITAYFEHENDAKIQLIPTPNIGFGGSGVLPTRNLEDYQQFSQEIRLQSDTGNTIDWMVGAYYSHAELDARNRTGFHFVPFSLIVPGLITPLAPNTPVGGRPTLLQKDDVYSVFGSLTWNVNDSLRINAAARYSRVDKQGNRTMTWGILDGELGGPDGETFTPLPLADQLAIGNNRGVSMTDYADTTRTDDDFMPSVGVEYDITPDVMAYASWSYGFKAGGFDASAQGGIYGPETVSAFEAGIKATLGSGTTLNVAAFRSDYDDLQETTILFIGEGAAQRITAVTANAGGARVQGLEVSASSRVAEWLTLSADLGYLDAVYTDFPNASCTVLGNVQRPNCVQDMSGKRRGYAPEWTGTLAANIEVPLSDNLELRIDPALFFTSDFFLSATADPLLKQDGFARADLRIGIGPFDRSWEVALISRNLNDVATSSFVGPLPTSNGATIVYPDRPRTVALAVSFKF